MKKCNKCLETKPFDDYFKHKTTKDGFHAYCKGCILKYSKERYSENMKNPEWVLKERERTRFKYRKLGGYSYTKKYPSNQKDILANRRRLHFKNNPEKHGAHKATIEMKAVIKGNHLHHWSYNKEHWKDVVEISASDHRMVHRFLSYDKKTFFFKKLDNGLLLDTKELHQQYIFTLINNKETYNIQTHESKSSRLRLRKQE